MTTIAKKTVTLSAAQLYEVETALGEHVKFLEEGVRIYSRAGDHLEGRDVMLAHYRRRLLALNNAIEILAATPYERG